MRLKGCTLKASKGFTRQNFSQKNLAGFTLIELLVVIAIIGILASVVLSSLNSARSKSYDVAIKSNLYNLRHQAELYQNSAGNYGTAFGPAACAATAGTLFAEATVSSILTASGGASVTGGGIGQASCVSTALAWAVSVPLRTTPADSWCVDSAGTAKLVTPTGGDLGFSGTACK